MDYHSYVQFFTPAFWYQRGQELLRLVMLKARPYRPDAGGDTLNVYVNREDVVP
jgi:hypothetical protein